MEGLTADVGENTVTHVPKKQLQLLLVFHDSFCSRGLGRSVIQQHLGTVVRSNSIDNSRPQPCYEKQIADTFVNTQYIVI